jgi:hypothetical protein
VLLTFCEVLSSLYYIHSTAEDAVDCKCYCHYRKCHFIHVLSIDFFFFFFFARKDDAAVFCTVENAYLKLDDGAAVLVL